MAGSPEFAHTQLRTGVFEQALAGAGPGGASSLRTIRARPGAEATRQLLNRYPAPTAIVYDSDLMAVAGLGAAQEMGVHVPGELSIASFDDSLMCGVVRPSLTACARDVVGYGAEAARALDSPRRGRAVPPTWSNRRVSSRGRARHPRRCGRFPGPQASSGMVAPAAEQSG